MSGNSWTNVTTQKISRTDIDRYILIYTQIHIGMSKSSILDSSDSTGTRGTRTRIPIGTTSRSCGLNLCPRIDNIRQSATQYLRKSNKLDTYIDGKFTNNLVVLYVFTEVICDKLSSSSIWDIHTCY